MKVFVAGATGETGRRILQVLQEKNVPVKALVRNPEKAREILPSGVEIVIGDVLNPQTFKNALSDCTTVICATGARPSFDPSGPYMVDYVGTKNLIDVTKEMGINRFILVSSLCVSQFFHPLNLFWLVLFWKKQVEDYLKASGLTYTIVRPGGLKNEDNSDKIVMSSADTLFEGSIPRLKVAQVCVESLYCEEAQQKILEIVAKPEAENRSFSDLFAQVS